MANVENAIVRSKHAPLQNLTALAAVLQVSGTTLARISHFNAVKKPKLALKGSVMPSHDNTMVRSKPNYLKQPSKSSSIAPAFLLMVNSMSKVKNSGYPPEKIVVHIKQFDAGGKNLSLNDAPGDTALAFVRTPATDASTSRRPLVKASIAPIPENVLVWVKNSAATEYTRESGHMLTHRAFSRLRSKASPSRFKPSNSGLCVHPSQSRQCDCPYQKANGQKFRSHPGSFDSLRQFER